MGARDHSVAIISQIARWVILGLCLKALMGNHAIEVKIGAVVALSAWCIDAAFRFRRLIKLRKRLSEKG